MLENIVAVPEHRQPRARRNVHPVPSHCAKWSRARSASTILSVNDGLQGHSRSRRRIVQLCESAVVTPAPRAAAIKRADRLRSRVGERSLTNHGKENNFNALLPLHALAPFWFWVGRFSGAAHERQVSRYEIREVGGWPVRVDKQSGTIEFLRAQRPSP